MVLPQRARREDEFSLVPPDIANSARRYQELKVVEKEQLALMARHNLLLDWPVEVRDTVIEAREAIREVRAARDAFRAQVREFVVALRTMKEPLSNVLRHTRSMIELLEHAGAIQSDGGWLEAEVLEWAIEEYENAA
ncbi:MAG TPA: hypothetical protein VN706_00545 [Gemmatimonadaceae bacterium]|nr:hypothetical protein [Gemmatimonadaceae bacterium]